MLTNTNLGFLLHDVARRYRARFDTDARALGVTRQQWRALLHLSLAEGQTQAELADRLEVERITLCRMVDRLSEAGLVERRSDPHDRRVWRLHLTADARQIVERLAVIGNRLEDEALAILGDDDARSLRSALARLSEGLKEAPATKVAA